MNKFQESELRAEFKNTIIKIMNIAKIRTTPDEVDQVVDEYFSSFVLSPVRASYILSVANSLTALATASSMCANSTSTFG